jgi:HK97 family phage major capsid protein
MDDKVLAKAMERFDASISKFEEKQDGKIESVLGRVDTLEALLSTGGDSSGSQRRAARERKAFREWASSGDIETQVIERAAGKAMSLGGGQDILAPELLSRQIMKFEKDSNRLPFEVNRVSVSTGDYKINTRVTPPVASWITETGSRSATADPEYRQVTPVGGELYAVNQIWNWLLNDSQYALEREIAQDIAMQRGRALDNGIINGAAASGEIRGFLTQTPTTDPDFSSPLRNANALQYIAAPSPDDLIEHMLSTFFTLNSAYRANAIWVMNSNTLSLVRNHKDTTGQPVFQNTYGTGVDTGDGTLFGKRVVVSEYMPDIAQSPLSFPIAVGDFRQMYTLVEVGVPTFIRDPFTTKGATTLYYATRHLGAVVNNDAVKLVQR